MKISNINSHIVPEYFFMAVLISMAMFRFNFGDIRTFILFLFEVSIAVLFAVYLIKNINIWVGMFLLLMLFTYSYRLIEVFPSQLILPEMKQYYINQSYLAINMAILGLVFYSGIVLYCSKIEHLLLAIIVIALIHCTFVFMKFFGVAPYKLLSGGKWWVDNPNPLGVATNTNEAGALLVICFAAFLRPKWIWLSFLPILALLSIKTLNGPFGVAAILIAFSLFSFKNWWLKISIIVAVSVLFFMFYRYIDYGHQAIIFRLKAWELAKDFLLDTKNGVYFGCGNWLAVYPSLVKSLKFPNGWVRLHNSYVHCLVEMGPFFIPILLGYIVDVARRYLKSPLKKDLRYLISGVIGIAAVCSTNSMFRMNAMNAMVAISVVAMLEVKLRQGESRIHEL